MVENRSVEPSEGFLSSELIDAGALLLDSSTNSGRNPDQKGYKITAWPSCSEASIQRSKVPSGYIDLAYAFERQFSAKDNRGALSHWSDVAPDWTETGDELRVRQGKTAVRRFGRHNGLVELVTFTYAVLPNLSLVSDHLHYFWRKWREATGREIPPYVWVPEWGEKTGRLHIHIGVSWWFELKCVEVCPRCDKYEVLKKFPRSVPENALCVGCLWGRGFVGRPESNVDGRGLGGYLTKYIAKDLGKLHYDPQTGKPVEFEGVPFGGHRYHLSRGHKPSPVALWAPDLLVAQLAANEVAGGGQPAEFSKVFEAEETSFGYLEYHDYLRGGEANVQNL